MLSAWSRCHGSTLPTRYQNREDQRIHNPGSQQEETSNTTCAVLAHPRNLLATFKLCSLPPLLLIFGEPRGGLDEPDAYFLADALFALCLACWGHVIYVDVFMPGVFIAGEGSGNGGVGGRVGFFSLRLEVLEVGFLFGR